MCTQKPNKYSLCIILEKKRMFKQIMNKTGLGVLNVFNQTDTTPDFKLRVSCSAGNSLSKTKS